MARARTKSGSTTRSTGAKTRATGQRTARTAASKTRSAARGTATRAKRTTRSMRSRRRSIVGPRVDAARVWQNEVKWLDEQVLHSARSSPKLRRRL